MWNKLTKIITLVIAFIVGLFVARKVTGQIINMWEVKITPINIEKKQARISATRTEGELVFTTSTTGILDTPAHKTAILDAIWSDWQRYQENQTNIASIIGDLEITGAANLDARE